MPGTRGENDRPPPSIHQGVYAVGHAGLTDKGRWKAATLALGDRVSLSHRSAGELWDLLPATGSLPSLTVVGISGRMKRRELNLHRSRTLTRAMTTIRNGIPVTNPGRTPADLATVASPREVRKATRQAEFLGHPLGEAVSDAGLVVEVDDWKSHRGRQAFEDDRARDADLAERGLTVIRFTDRQLRTEPASVTAALETITSRRDIVATANESLEPPP